MGPYFSFKGIDNNIYYMLTPDGKYYNFSGCGNVLNCNQPIVQQFILDCLRYWVTEYRIDGFRFDLASILGRNEDGTPMDKPPLLKSLAFDPILGGVKLIAEAWDAGGLYQVGSFRHGTDGLNGTEDTVTTSENFLKATAILHGMRLRELQAQEICMTLPTEATMRR